MRPLPLEPLAGVPPEVLGAAIIRGVPTPVVDVRRLLGGAADPPARFVTIRAGATTVALAVDHVVGVVAVEPAALHALPPLLSGAAAGAVAAIGRLDAELLLVLEAARLVPPELLAAPGGAP